MASHRQNGNQIRVCTRWRSAIRSGLKIGDPRIAGVVNGGRSRAGAAADLLFRARTPMGSLEYPAGRERRQYLRTMSG